MKDGQKIKRIFDIVSGFVAVGCTIILDCNLLIKLLVIIGIICVCICSDIYRWSNERLIIGLLCCLAILNIYCELTIYIPYRAIWSASSNIQVGFSSSQVCYTYNSGNADALLCMMLRDREVSLYGNCKMYQRYFQLYSKEIIVFDYKEKIDFLMEKRESFLDMGRMSLCSASDCFNDTEIETLREYRQDRLELYQLFLSANMDQISDKENIVVAIDSMHNIYIMTDMEWRALKGE
ncbi:hypothetical protein C808_00917 [Lachnospiraceae bacterium M18-1]|nr:hypothetical protein [uncultured Schaedlerella sp.]EOS39946.1 hypothetical protein C808_00917 [Lachnospiraceae bacterium M18-1]MCI9152211.1 hypothetical protein [Ruminococcus sp.]